MIPVLLGELDDAYWHGAGGALSRSPGRAALIGMPMGDPQRGYTNSALGLSAADDAAAGRLLPLRQAPPGAVRRVRSARLSLVHADDEHPARRLQPRPADGAVVRRRRRARRAQHLLRGPVRRGARRALRARGRGADDPRQPQQHRLVRQDDRRRAAPAHLAHARARAAAADDPRHQHRRHGGDRPPRRRHPLAAAVHASASSRARSKAAGADAVRRLGRPLRPLAAVGDRRCVARRRLARGGPRPKIVRSALPHSRPAPSTKRTPGAMLSFQQIILRLQSYWAERGCALLQPYDMEVGAGTSHTATFLRALGPEPWKAAYVQPSRRPKDGRYGENPNRLQHYYQYQVVLKPAPADILDLYLGSLEALGFDLKEQRRPLRRGRLGEPDARRLGPRLGGLAERHGGDPVHLLPAGRRHRLQADHRRDHLRPRAAGDVPAGRRQRLQAAVDRRAQRTATSTTRTKSSRAPTTSRRATSSSCSPRSPRTSARRRR